MVKLPGLRGCQQSPEVAADLGLGLARYLFAYAPTALPAKVDGSSPAAVGKLVDGTLALGAPLALSHGAALQRESQLGGKTQPS